MKVAEVSFEVGNKLGGIHTVLASKARLMTETFDDYFVVGYYNENKSKYEFTEEEAPEHFARAMDELRKEGVIVKYGRWLVPGKPPAVLLHPGALYEKKSEIKYWYWENYGVDSLRSDDWFDTPAVWAYAVGKFLEALGIKHPVIFHEWLSGGALLYLRKHAPHVPTIFHTHATMLGRTLVNAGEDLYGMIASRSPDPDGLAYKYWLEAKHLMEKASAQNAHVFTAVSEITAEESAYILGRYPDVLLYNGLDMTNIPPIEELAHMHTVNERKVTDFLRAYFAPYYNVDLENALYFFFSGRYDIRAKGIPLLIDALALLNERLKKEESPRTLVFFFFVARSDYPQNREVLENLAIYRSIIRNVDEAMAAVRERIVRELIQGNVPENVLDDETRGIFRRYALLLKQKDGKMPPISTHVPSPDDYIANALRERGLLNGRDDPVKVIYYPGYVTPGDGLLGMNYFQVVTGMHFGVFPSMYEPWGYTPLETAAWGVPSLTTDVAGFGLFLKKQYGEFVRRSGISVLSVRNVDYAAAVEELADIMHWLLTMPRRNRIEMKIEAKYMARGADWNNFIQNYVQAVELATHRAR